MTLRTIPNALNDLTGREWLYWTSTVYETCFPPDATHRHRKQHGAMKPPELMAEIISFFTKPGELVLDPFAGVGGTLLGAALTGRRSLGLEIHPRWREVYHDMQAAFRVRDGKLVAAPSLTVRKVVREGSEEPATESLPVGLPIDGEMRLGDCLELMSGMPGASVEAIITDPPYGWQHGATGFKDETNFNMFSQDDRDFARSPDMAAFLSKMEQFGHAAHRVLKPQRYLVVIIGDRYMQGEMVPLGTLVAERLRNCGFQFKGLRLWWNKATQRPLKPYAVKTAFVPNIVHQNILVLRKIAE